MPDAGADGPTAVVRRILPVPPATVFDQWIDPAALADWMCPRPARCLAVALEPWVGGAIRLDIEDAGTTFAVVGHFRTLDRPRRLSFTWSCSTWTEPDRVSVVTVSLDPQGADRTLMTIEHRQLPPDLVGTHREGWSVIAAQLEVELRPAVTPPPPG